MASNNKMQIHLADVQKTLLITLYAKAIDNRSKNPILHDAKADELVGMIDYDFTKLNSWGNDNLIVVRAKHYDDWIQEFIKRSPVCIVLNLGCGLDTRATRINPPATVSWFDIDFPDVIQLRKNFYADHPGYRMIESSITDRAWLTEIPTGRPVMIIAEGVLEYLTAEEAKMLLNRLTEYFSHGVIAFDVMNSFAIQSAKSAVNEPTAGLHKWEVNDIREVDALDTKLRRDNENILALLQARPEVKGAKIQNDHLFVELQGENRIGPLVTLIVQSGGEIEDIHRMGTSLEDLFLTLMKEA